MSESTLVPPKAPARLNIPKSNNAVRISIIDTTSRFSFPSHLFHTPTYKGTERLSGPSFSFLIEHDGERVLFDLGIRKDWENLPPGIVALAKHIGATFDIKKNVSEILEENGIPVRDGAVDTVIWSHPHFDHIGDLTTFPTSTKLVVGKGFKEGFLPAYPENQKSDVFAHDFQDRELHEIDFKQGLKIGRFDAHDYFGDGSFYLLDTPGHMVGHMCGLARTTVLPPTFVFLGGDASHHAGELRPSEYLPIPTNLVPSPIPHTVATVCPGHLFVDVHCGKSANAPFLSMSKDFNHDLEAANWSIAGLQEFDSAENVLIIIAHDPTVEAVLDFFPKGTLNDWYEKDAGAKTRWRFLGQLEQAVQENKRQ
ncbi:hypothetical protein AAFC00_002280 [Neodothiora populina]|uniref:Metallo-beta-lactamase domain-containing protein n=1 Tax=Neodothiora populina TaxID=2781224 RepID=A0ABR3PGW3_9PEZI